MMKKLLLLSSALLTIGFSVKAQNEPIAAKTTTSGTVVSDILRYFTHKQYFLAPITPTPIIHPYYGSQATVVSNTAITHIGSIFKNTTSLTVKGLEAVVLKQAGGPTIQSIPVKIYLCNVVGGLPVLPAIDSISTSILNNIADQFGNIVGGNFLSAKTVTSDFAVLVRNASGLQGDVVRIFRTAGHTATSTTAPNPANRFGEGLGVVRNGGIFYKTTNYAHPDFGVGTDYEFCVAPIVEFTLNVDQIQSPTQEGACCWQVFTNTNTSTPALTNRQFNFNEFYRQFKPFVFNTNMPGGFAPDSVLTWNLGDGGNPFFLAPNTNTVNLLFGGGDCNKFFTGSLTAIYKPSDIPLSSLSIPGILTYTSSTVWCPGDTTGSSIRKYGSLANIKFYPNPTFEKTTISGLKGENTVLVYNMFGQLVSTTVTDKETHVIDLIKQPVGNYLIRINDNQNNSRVVKVIKQ
jgi:hypothetical protein